MIYTRLTFNCNNWGKPSGREGKSKNKYTHEAMYGFGFEEWLFSPKNHIKSKDMEEYCYGYIEGIHKNYREGDEDHTIVLFTINNKSKDRYIVAKIKKWKFVNYEESTLIINENKNLIKEMEEQLKDNVPDLKKAKHKFYRHVGNEKQKNDKYLQLFNIKYKKDDLELFLNHFPKERNHPIYNYHRFWLHRKVK